MNRAVYLADFTRLFFGVHSVMKFFAESYATYYFNAIVLLLCIGSTLIGDSNVNLFFSLIPNLESTIYF